MQEPIEYFTEGLDFVEEHLEECAEELLQDAKRQGVPVEYLQRAIEVNNKLYAIIAEKLKSQKAES